MSLASWSTRLERHFRELALHREQGPVFALEHGLSKPDVREVAADVRRHIVRSGPTDDHAFPCLVYAAELGYRYSGDEYWTTFEQQTPGWTRANRAWMRDSFQRFSLQGGARPSGPWAEHYSFICWPLTHAVLPRDLQRQLARILYEMRHRLAMGAEHPITLGEQIAESSLGASARFRDFAEQVELTGRIAAALLSGGGPNEPRILLPSTLQRIVADLERESDAKTWLAKARHVAGKGKHAANHQGRGGPHATWWTPRPVARPELTQPSGSTTAGSNRSGGPSPSTLRVLVTVDDIASGVQRSPRRCPIARAMERLGLPSPSIAGAYVRLGLFGVGQSDVVPLPAPVTEWIRAYDRGSDVGPFEFELQLP